VPVTDTKIATTTDTTWAEALAEAEDEKITGLEESGRKRAGSRGEMEKGSI
jgi:hypothetical protein